MTSVVVMVTVSERVDSLNRFLGTLAKNEPGRPIAIHMQGEDRREDIDSHGVDIVHYRHTEQRLGCHAARVVLLRDLTGYDTYINVDDDVELLEQTNWQPAIDKAHEPGTGFVLTNWVRHPNQLPARIAAMEDKFYPQVMVYNGGGMTYSNDTADLIRALDPEPARYDDIWPITAYLSGRRNYRYQGSLALHRIMSKGGMNHYMRVEPRPLLCWDWVNYRLLNGAPVGSDYAIPADYDIKQSAKDTHAKRRSQEGWS